MLSALGGQVGLEVGDQIVEVGGDQIEEVPDQTEEVQVDQVVEVPAVTVEEELEVETVVEFDCPDAGFFPSQTNCAQYYQCTADRTVIIISIWESSYFGDISTKYFEKSQVKITEVLFVYTNIHCSRLCSTVRMVSTTTQLSTPVTGRTWSSVTSPVLSSGLLEVVEVVVEMDQARK